MGRARGIEVVERVGTALDDLESTERRGRGRAGAEGEISDFRVTRRGRNWGASVALTA